MSAAPDLAPDVVPIERLTGPRERFRCAPLRATLEAGMCVLRQRIAAADLAAQRSSAHGKACGITPRYRECADCADGRSIAARVSIDREAPASPTALAQARARGKGGRPKGSSPRCSRCGALGHDAGRCGRAKPPANDAAPPPPTTAPPAAQEPSTVLQDSRSEAKSEASSKAKAGSKPATCNHPSGCSRPAAGARADTRKGTEGWCRWHRKNDLDRHRTKPRTAATPKRQAAPTRKATARLAAKPARAVASAIDHAAAVALVTRCLAVVARLGGVDRAEQLATLVAGGA